MNCPKCGGENPDNAQVCGSCNAVLVKSEERRLKPKANASKLAILSLVLGILSLFLFVLVGIPSIVVGIISLLKIKRSGGALKGKYIALAGMNVSIVFMCIFYWLWSRDAPPIPNDYTLADLRSAPAEYAESFEILKLLIDEDLNIPDAPAIGLSDGDLDMIAEIRGILKDGTATEISQIFNYYFKDIKSAWAGSKKSRDVIHRLNEFPEIADLTEPGARTRIMRYKNLIELARLFQVYAHLQTTKEDVLAFIAELIELDSVFRKLSVNVRLFIGRAVCLKCMEEDIVTANFIVNNPKTIPKTIALLAKYFTPITTEQTSLRNAILSEYFRLKDIVSQPPDQNIALKTPLLKKNSTLRLFRNFYDDWMEAIEDRKHITRTILSVWPNKYPFTEPSMTFGNQKRLPLLYRCYNPLIGIIRPFYSTKLGKDPISQTQIQDDLFQIVLNKRFGKEVSLKARAYGGEYIIDIKNKKILSPEPDGKVGTKDDIKLRINPKVLGWGS